MEDEQELRENRFGYLLQPIRDLAENWNIDIATELENYLEELGNLMVNFQGKRMNFTEAALLIQGSAAVYSKKVEYLHGLVLQTLELLADRRKEKAKKAGDDDGDMDGDDEDDAEGEWKDEFDLPDVGIDEATDIYLDLNDDNERYEQINMGEDPTILPSIPMSLIPLEEWEKSDVVIKNSNGEVVGKREDFRVNTCFVHSSGALLLDLENEQYINEVDNNEQRRLFSRHTDVFGLSSQNSQNTQNTNSQQPLSQQNVYTQDPVPPSMGSPEKGDRPPSEFDISAGIMEGSACEDMLMADNIENTLVPNYDENDANRPSSVENMRDGAVTMLRPSDMQPRGSSVVLKDAQQIRSSARLAERVINASQASIVKQPVVVDPWQELDPFDDTKNVDRPVKKAKCTRTALECTRLYNRRWDKEHCDQDGKVEPEIQAGYPREWLTQFITNHFYSCTRDLPKNKLKVPSMPALNDICLRAYRRRLDTRKGWKNFVNVAREPDTEDEENNDFDNNESVSIDADADGGDADVDEPIGDQLPNSQENEIPAINIVDMDFIPPEEIMQQRKEECMQKMMQQEELSMQKISEMSYQDLVTYFVDKYLSSAQDFVITTELTRRVQEWEGRVKPMLDEEETRRNFDIHLYGSEILEKFQKIGETKSFYSLMGKVHDFDVSRYFLSTLMMANTRNVEIGHNEMRSHLGEGEHEMDKMALKYLTSERHHEQFQ